MHVQMTADLDERELQIQAFRGSEDGNYQYWTASKSIQLGYMDWAKAFHTGRLLTEHLKA